MRSCQLSAISFQLAAFAALCGVPGCGPPKNVAITTVPSTEELPVLPRVQAISEATVAVEGGPVETGFRLVPEFKLPELTPAEKAALGPEKVHFKFLLYNELSLPPNSTVGPWWGGITTAINGTSRIATLYERQRPIASVMGRAGTDTLVDPYASRIASTYSPSQTTVIAGPRSALTVETDPAASRIARREPHKTP